jgi:hypothetical protein
MNIKDSRETEMAGIQWGEPESGLKLGLGCEGKTLCLLLRNIGTCPVTVLSHVLAEEHFHFDWVVLCLESDSGERHMLRLIDDRDRSAEVKVRLDPGASLKHSVDLVVWLKKRLLKVSRLGAGTYKVSATYEIENRSDVWHGSVRSGTCFVVLDAGAERDG